MRTVCLSKLYQKPWPAHNALSMHYQAILNFWFGHALDLSDIAIGHQQKSLWWRKSLKTDDTIRSQFLATHQYVTTHFESIQCPDPLTNLALILLLDQFSRHIYRHHVQAYAYDHLAQRLSVWCIDQALDQALRPIARIFIYLPLEHSEDLALQNRSLLMFANLLDQAQPQERDFFQNHYDYAVKHQCIITRFGRFPHRNKVLNRPSTLAEVYALNQEDIQF